MFFWPPLAKPSGFDAFVRPARAKIAKIIRERNPTSLDFDPEWSEVSTKYKPLFVTHQQRRCGWCDRELTEYGALDHLRPKASLELLDPANPGREVAGGVNRDRRFPRSRLREETPGYWWLAFRWSNYVLACTQCNSGWKGAFVARATDTPERFSGASPKTCGTEGWNLLHPFAATRAAEHFAFNEDGSVGDRTPAGRATIDVVGLDRDSLRRARMLVVVDVARLSKRFEHYLIGWLDDGRGLDSARDALGDLLRKGHVERPLASVARAVAEDRLRMSWAELGDLEGELGVAASL